MFLTTKVAKYIKMSVIARCYNCNQNVYFDDRIRNGYGSAIRLDDHGEPHRCKHKYQKTGFNETQKCFKCGESIFFDVNYVSISGKCIPLGSYSGKSHVCSKAQIIASS
jgi:hypothetical protein